MREYVLIPLSKLEMLEKTISDSTKTSTQDSDSSDETEPASGSELSQLQTVKEEIDENKHQQHGESPDNIDDEETGKVDAKIGEGGTHFRKVNDSTKLEEAAANLSPPHESSRQENLEEQGQQKPDKGEQGRKRKREGISVEQRRKRMEINWLSV